MSDVKVVESSVIYSSDCISVAEEDVPPIADDIVPLDDESAPWNETEATLESIEEEPCMAHTPVDEDVSRHPDASDVDPLTECVSEC